MAKLFGKGGKRYTITSLLVLLFLVTFLMASLPPRSFPKEHTLTVEKGDGLRLVSARLEKENLIRSRFIFEFLVVLVGGEESIAYGEYYFEKPIGALAIAKQLVGHDFNISYKKVTIPEGLTNKEIEIIMDKAYKNFDPLKFAELTKEKEGYLFPDTYFFFPAVSTEEIVSTLLKNFETKTRSLADDIAKSAISKSDIVIVASLIEAETNGNDDREMIAGIIAHRLRIGMPLQIDATVAYALLKLGEPLSLSDLKTDSPYNTYIHKGLPPGPIGNPGLVSLSAVLHPTQTSYLYYLHDENGTIHYANTFEEHKRNKSLYLK